jgi:hypothetical protein
MHLDAGEISQNATALRTVKVFNPLVRTLFDPIVENAFNAEETGIVQPGKLRHIHMIRINAAIRIR